KVVLPLELPRTDCLRLQIERILLLATAGKRDPHPPSSLQEGLKKQFSPFLPWL
ncbi:UNVERIFIED_CONTAM: hypothetical protein K2H54_072578, partial [Gekko kuhli]